MRTAMRIKNIEDLGKEKNHTRMLNVIHIDNDDNEIILCESELESHDTIAELLKDDSVIHIEHYILQALHDIKIKSF